MLSCWGAQKTQDRHMDGEKDNEKTVFSRRGYNN